MDHKKRMHGFGFAAVFIALYFLSMPSAFSDDGIKIRPVVKDETLISPELLQKLLPGADRVAAQEGKPPARAVYKDGKLYGYIVSTHVVMDSTGFAGNPFDILVGLGMDAQIKGAHLADHNEPILIIGVAEKKIYEYVDQFRGVDIRNRVMPGIAPENGTPRIDGVSGASISSVIMSDAILRSSRLVARSRKILVSSVGRGTLDIDSFRKSDWAQLLADGDVKRLRIQNKDLSKFFRKQGVTVSLAGDEDATFIDLYVTLATPATIGRNLLGENSYQRLMAQKESQGQLIFIAAQGLYSFKGTTWKKTGLFDRIQIIQGERTIRLLKNQYLRVDKINAPGAPNLREAALFTLPANSGLVATDPWQLDLLVERESSSGEKVFAGFQAQYELPSRYIQTQSSDPKLSDDYAFMKDSSGEDAYWVS
ncbi:MAG: hypothetical protein OEY85_07170, partial [Rhodospirillales bacterium]|nr:hypothetical protein [Rhodospirillales bacterium]